MAPASAMAPLEPEEQVSYHWRKHDWEAALGPGTPAWKHHHSRERHHHEELDQAVPEAAEEPDLAAAPSEWWPRSWDPRQGALGAPDQDARHPWHRHGWQAGPGPLGVPAASVEEHHHHSHTHDHHHRQEHQGLLAEGTEPDQAASPAAYWHQGWGSWSPDQDMSDTHNKPDQDAPHHWHHDSWWPAEAPLAAPEPEEDEPHHWHRHSQHGWEAAAAAPDGEGWPDQGHWHHHAMEAGAPGTDEAAHHRRHHWHKGHAWGPAHAPYPARDSMHEPSWAEPQQAQPARDSSSTGRARGLLQLPFADPIAALFGAGALAKLGSLPFSSAVQPQPAPVPPQQQHEPAAAAAQDTSTPDQAQQLPSQGIPFLPAAACPAAACCRAAAAEPHQAPAIFWAPCWTRC